MDVRIIEATKDTILERIYIATATLGNFKGHKHVQVHIFRDHQSEQELEELKSLNLVGDPDPRMPPELLAGATVEAALKCILESFTLEEAKELASYLQTKYSSQMEKLVICPLELPVPLGIGPLGSVPESKRAAFINFDKASDYPFPFSIKAYFDLGSE